MADLKRLKDAASEGRLGEELGNQIHDAARKVTGYIDRNTPGSAQILPQNYDMYRDALASGARKVGKAVSDTVDAAKTAVSEGARKVLGSKKKGGRISKSGVYRLHRGEKVRRSSRSR